MPDYTDNSFRAAIKALTDVVAPAVGPSNPLAVEQLRLVTQYLEFFSGRRSSLASYERAELRLHVELAEALAEILGEVDHRLRSRLSRSLADARVVLGTDDGESAGRATSELATLIGTIVRELDDDTLRRRVERTIVERSGALLDLKRAWFLPFGFESAPDKVPALADLLASEVRRA